MGRKAGPTTGRTSSQAGSTGTRPRFPQGHLSGRRTSPSSGGTGSSLTLEPSSRSGWKGNSRSGPLSGVPSARRGPCRCPSQYLTPSSRTVQCSPLKNLGIDLRITGAHKFTDQRVPGVCVRTGTLYGSDHRPSRRPTRDVPRTTRQRTRHDRRTHTTRGGTKRLPP